MKMRKIILVIVLVFVCQTSLYSQTKEPENRGYSVSVGDKAPDFTIQYLDGTTQQLSDMRGKVVMLQFTAGWCKVCRKEMPHIENEIWQVHKDNPNFALVAVDLKESKDKIEKFIADMKVTYPLTLDENGAIFSLYTEKGAGVTRNIIIDQEGKIVFLTRLFDKDEFEQMKKTINELLDNYKK